MKVIILAGGLGTRLQEETAVRPKPMVEIGGKPILWHIMQSYAGYGFKEFVVALGYKGEWIKKFFLNYYHLGQDFTAELGSGKIKTCGGHQEDWKVSLVDTGEATLTGGRIKRLQKWIGNKPFMATYGDGVSDINIAQLVEFHRQHKKYATITAVRPPARFGRLEIDGDRVTSFQEKPQIGEGWINGGFFVFQPEVFKYIEADETILEREPLENLAKDKQLRAYKHAGFWRGMDTLRDVRMLEDLWKTGKAPWLKNSY